MNLGATRFKEQNDKTTCESSNDKHGKMINEMCMIVGKKDVPTIEWATKIPFLVVICGSIDFWCELGLKLNIGVAC